MSTATRRPGRELPAYKIPFTTAGWEKCFESLGAIRTLKEDWDDDGALVPSAALVNAGEEILRFFWRWLRIPAPSRVGPGPNGTVLIEWQNGLNYFEIEVCDPHSAEWMMALPNEKPEHGKGLDQVALDRLTLTLSL
jgi:hypothetical protein